MVQYCCHAKLIHHDHAKTVQHTSFMHVLAIIVRTHDTSTVLQAAETELAKHLNELHAKHYHLQHPIYLAPHALPGWMQIIQPSCNLLSNPLSSSCLSSLPSRPDKHRYSLSVSVPFLIAKVAQIQLNYKLCRKVWWVNPDDHQEHFAMDSRLLLAACVLLWKAPLWWYIRLHHTAFQVRPYWNFCHRSIAAEWTLMLTY